MGICFATKSLTSFVSVLNRKKNIQPTFSDRPAININKQFVGNKTFDQLPRSAILNRIEFHKILSFWVRINYPIHSDISCRDGLLFFISPIYAAAVGAEIVVLNRFSFGWLFQIFFFYALVSSFQSVLFFNSLPKSIPISFLVFIVVVVRRMENENEINNQQTNKL